MTEARLLTGCALRLTGSLALKADRVALGLVVLAASADAIAQLRDWPVDLKVWRNSLDSFC